MSTSAPRLHVVPRNPAGLPPAQAVDSERLVLGASLEDLTAFDRISDLVQPDHFFGEDHRIIAEALWTLAAAGKPVGLIEVTGWLREHDRLETAGGPGYLSKLAFHVPTTYNLEFHARLVRDKSRIRLLAAEARRISAECYAPIDDPQDFLDAAEHAIGQVACPPEQARVITLQSSLTTVFQRIEAAAASGRTMTGTPTGFTRLDALLCGLHPAEQVVLAARPGMGKTAAGMAIALNVAGAAPIEGQPRDAVLFFSSEMNHEQLTQRAICTEARVNGNRLRSNSLGTEDWQRLTQAASWLSTLPILIDDTAPIGPLELRAKARRVAAEMKRGGKLRLALVVVDYVQIMRASDLLPKNANREQEVSFCSLALKNLSKELQIPVLVLAQLNRALEKQKDKRPMLSDLRESGALEQNADTVLFIHREEYYLKERTPPDQRGVAELIVAKQRNGPLGTARTWFWPEFTLFTDTAPAGAGPLSDDPD